MVDLSDCTSEETDHNHETTQPKREKYKIEHGKAVVALVDEERY